MMLLENSLRSMENIFYSLHSVFPAYTALSVTAY